MAKDPYWCCLLQYCVMNDCYVGCDLPSLDQQFLKEEFHAATDLLSRVLCAKDEPQENQDDIASPKIANSMLSEDQTDSTVLQNQAACTKNNDLQPDKCQAVTMDADSNSLSCNFVYNFRNLESNEQQDNASNGSRIEDTNLLTSDENYCSRFSHEAVGLNERTGGRGGLCLSNMGAESKSVIKEHDSDSEGELEQFILQPRNGRHFSNRKL
ncbi:hypothetical protein OS493_037276 [Desmophyllum pertusum]|uniref:Uncharacterized protein n=1 Tax=Desmophyllum pertusum TaxID=174260 RepID=A0A9W9YAC8_9CNID|nr:hypothetical protein OS493_037276 [Desmophyllum pertusum]